MRRSELMQLVKRVSVMWPNAPEFDPYVLEAWWDVLNELDGEWAFAALKSIHEEGKDFAPNAGQVYQRAKALIRLLPPWECDLCDGTTWVLDEDTNTARHCSCHQRFLERKRGPEALKQLEMG